jgi:hypothetical protein
VEEEEARRRRMRSRGRIRIRIRIRGRTIRIKRTTTTTRESISQLLHANIFEETHRIRRKVSELSNLKVKIWQG